MFHRLFITLSATLLCAFSVLPTPQLEAASWGKTDEVFDYENVKWNGIYFDGDGLQMKASMPGYAGTMLQNDLVLFRGNVKNGSYVITTSYQPGFNPPKTEKEFVKMVQDANMDYIVSAVEPKKLGAKYVVDMIPKDSSNVTFWRFISTKNRLIRMGCEDTNQNRRLHFFESIYIQ